MPTFFSSLVEYTSTLDKLFTISWLGNDGTGITSLIRRATHNTFSEKIRTDYAPDILQYTHKNLRFLYGNLLDEHSLQESSALIIVIDSTDPESFSKTSTFLHSRIFPTIKILKLFDLPLLFLANKQDLLIAAVSAQMINVALNINHSEYCGFKECGTLNNPFAIYPVSSLPGDFVSPQFNIEFAFDWLGHYLLK